jgi:hypothetical protein
MAGAIDYAAQEKGRRFTSHREADRRTAERNLGPQQVKAMALDPKLAGELVC